MAAREKTRDELDMQTLRELAALPPNKFCFDCGQRGTTYVNVTIGAFVCSTCGGLLRGLNPPHRVKSLTVCSFTEVEMDRLQSRGNEYCTHIWLGRYDGKCPNADLTSPDKRKEFMIQKYEEKKYYVDPKEAIKKMKPRAPAVPTAVATSAPATNISVTRSHTAIPKQPPRIQSAGFISQTYSAGDIAKSTAPDLFKSDPFKSDPFKETQQGENTADGASFADFNSAFADSASSTSLAGQPSTSAPQQGAHKKPAPPPPDRYAALADLDNQLHQQVTPPDLPAAPIPSVIVASNPPPFWQPPTNASVVYAPPTINPFQHGAVPGWSQGTPNPFQAVPPQIPVSSNPLPQQNLNGIPNNAKSSLHNGSVASSFWQPASNATWGGPYPSVQPDPFLMNNAPADSYNPWAQSFGASGANPFGNNSFVPGPPTNVPKSNAKKNPFL